MKVVINNIEKIVAAGMVLFLVLVTSGGVAQAGHQDFYGTASVLRYNLSEFRLSQDDGATYTENLLDRNSVNFASVGIGEKAGEYISHKALACGHYNKKKYTAPSHTFKGIVAVDPDDWGGTWPAGDPGDPHGTRYYYTDEAGTGASYKSDEDEAKNKAQETEGMIAEPTREESCDIDISAGETTTLRLTIGIWLCYTAYYDDDDTKKFTNGTIWPHLGAGWATVK